MSFISATYFAIQAINTYKIASQKASVYAKIDKAAVLIASTSRKEDLLQGAEILSKGTQTDPVGGATQCRCTEHALSTQPCGCPASKKGCQPREGYTSLPMCRRECPQKSMTSPRFKGKYRHYHMDVPFVIGQQCSTVPVKIGGQKYRELLDSGAWHSIIPAAVVKKIQPEASLRKSSTHCVGAGNEDLNIIGDIELPVFMPTSIDPYIWEFAVTSVVWPGIDLIFDVDFLSATGAHLDYENGMAHFSPCAAIASRHSWVCIAAISHQCPRRNYNTCSHRLYPTQTGTTIRMGIDPATPNNLYIRFGF
jgi:hypothetical protein